MHATDAADGLDRGDEHGRGSAVERGWIAAARRGDGAAFGCLVDLYWSEFLVLARRVVGDHHTAQDVVQEAFVRVQQSMQRIDDDANFGGWASRIVRNVAIDRVRAAMRRAREVPEVETRLELVCEAEHEPRDADASPSRTAGLIRELDRLPAREREILVLRYGRGMSYRAIASEYGVPETHVKVAIHRGRARLLARGGPARRGRPTTHTETGTASTVEGAPVPSTGA